MIEKSRSLRYLEKRANDFDLFEKHNIDYVKHNDWKGTKLNIYS